MCRASYCEIYNEAIYDLLNFTNQQLPVRWDAAKGFHVPDLYIKECAEIQDLLQVASLDAPASLILSFGKARLSPPSPSPSSMNQDKRWCINIAWDIVFRAWTLS